MSGFGWVPTSDMVKVKLKLETIIYFAYAFLFMCMKKSMFFMISHASPPTNNPGQANGFRAEKRSAQVSAHLLSRAHHMNEMPAIRLSFATCAVFDPLPDGFLR